MFKKIFPTLLIVSMLISIFIPQTSFADSSTSGVTNSSGVSVQLEELDSWHSWWHGAKFWGHGYEDWFKDDKSSQDYSYKNDTLQFIKVKIKNDSDSDIVLDRNNQLVLQFSNTSSKELGLKLYDFVAYQNIDKATRNYTIGSSWFSYRMIKRGSTLEIYGYIKWMDFSELSCTIANQAKGKEVQVRLTEDSVNKANPTDRIHSVLKLYNEGNKVIDLNKIRIHYYFNMDGDLDKVAPKYEKVEGKVYNYKSNRSNPYEYVIQTLPSAFINMEKYSGVNADTYIEIGFPQINESSSSYHWNFMYKFLRYYNGEYWCDRYSKYDNNWYDDILDYSDNYSWGGGYGKDNGRHRWWWKWDKDYTISSQNYSLNSKSSKGTSYVTVDLEIIKEILGGVTGDTSGLRKFYQLNHYSYNPGNEIDWEKVTVYYEGKLVWGNEPSASLIAPTNLKATAKKDGINLKWDEVANAESYKILRKSNNDTDFVNLPDVVTTNSFIDANVKADITYTYKVMAVSDNGQQQGPLSSEASAKALNMTGNGLYAEYYNWKDVPDGSRSSNYWYDYWNYFETNYILTNTDLALARVDPKIDFTKNNAVAYYKWGTTAPDEKVNEEHYSVIWSGYVMPKYSEKYTFYTNTDDGVRLWIDTDRSGTFEDDELMIRNWAKHSETENSVKNVYLLKNYKYKIKMEFFENENDAVAQLLWSSTTQNKEVIPTTQLFVDDTVTKPEIPINLTAVVQDDTTVQLTWDSVLGAVGYKIYETDIKGNVREIIVPNNNFYTIPALQSGEYIYTVSAYNDGGDSDKSEAIKVTIGLAAPSNLTTTVKDKSVTLAWAAVTGATAYKLYRVCDGVITEVACSTNGYIDKDVSWGKVYSYSVVALKGDSEGIRSSEVGAIISASPPTGLTADISDFSNVTLKWTASEGAQSYKVYRSKNSDGPFSEITIDEEKITETAFTDKTIQNPTEKTGKEYFYKVIAVSNGVDSNSSNISNVIIYPYEDTDLGLLRYYIISENLEPDFVLGSYVPVAFQIKLKGNTNTPTISVKFDAINDTLEPLTANLLDNINNNGAKMWEAEKNSISLGSDDLDITGNTMVFNGNFAKNDVIRVVFVVKISASTAALEAGIDNYYDKSFLLNLTMTGNQEGSSVSTNNNSMSVKIVKPDKLK